MRYTAIILAAVTLAGCATIERPVAADSEQILAQAGFQREPLEEPGLPARHLVQQGGAYKFADPKFCQCVYAGGAKEYAELQRLVAARKAEREWIMTRSTVAGAPVDRTTWSAWKPEGLELITAPVAGK